MLVDPEIAISVNTGAGGGPGGGGGAALAVETANPITIAINAKHRNPFLF